MKHQLHFVAVLFAVIISVSIALADDGCFTYADSPLYCKTISVEEAQDECSLYEDCNIETTFTSGTCDDVSAFPMCQKVLCKSSCSETFAEECTAGIIPEEEIEEWCSPGCCKFSYSGAEFCSYKTSKWLCEIEAKNKNVAQFNFGISTEEECIDSCATTTAPSEEENVPIKPSINITSKDNLTNETGKTETSGLGWFLVFLLMIIIGGILFYYRKFIFVNVAKLTSAPEEELENIMPVAKESDDDSFSKTLWKYLIKERLKPLTDKYQHKVRAKRREEFLLEEGLVVEKAPETTFSKLKKLTRKSKHPEHPISKHREEKKALERLNELTAKHPVESTLTKASSAPIKPISKPNPAIEELKKVAKGK